MNVNLPDADAFLKDVRDHQLTVIRDDRNHYRHLRFAKPDTYCMGFDIVTWPGYLCFCGDMGSYVFRRLPDMLDFFRADRRPNLGGWKIDHRYWAEKVEASDKDSSIKKYSPELFREAVETYLVDEDGEPREGVTDELREAINDEVLTHADEEHYAYRAAYEFRHEKFSFTDFFDHTLTDYTYRFRWCCMALAWAVEQYDQRERVAA